MKVWYGYGTEHSMNLVMIGHFKEAEDAANAKKIIELLTEQVNADVDAKQLKIGERTELITDGMVKLLRRLELYSLGATEMEQFVYDASIKIEDNRVIVTTDEIEVSAFLKVLIDKGARVEVYSAHNYQDTGHGR